MGDDTDDSDLTDEIKERLEDDDTLGGTIDSDSDTVFTLDEEGDE